MRDDLCVFILTHGRPDRVLTLTALERAGYSGKVYLVVDDEDKTLDQYKAKYGEKVLVFSKRDMEGTFDAGDNFPGRRGVIYARNACWGLARDVGCRYFFELDDDYSGFYYRFDTKNIYGSFRIRKTMDRMIEALVDFHEKTGALTVATSQGGDHIGGEDNGQRRPSLTRKAMNSFVCDVERPFLFPGRVNEDTSAYTSLSRQGGLFFTCMAVQLNQMQTQQHRGGMTELYLDGGTYIKSFYSVMYCPSSVKIGKLGDPRSPHFRIHHKINWHATAPKIISERWRK